MDWVIFILPLLWGAIALIYILCFAGAVFHRIFTAERNYEYNDFEEDGRTYVVLPNGEVRLD